MNNIYKNYKLSSGDEIIGKLEKNDLDTITLNRPMVIKTITLQNHFNETKEMVTLRPWNNMSNELTCKIKREHIILESIPTPEIVEAYKQQIEKEDIIDDLYSDLMNDPERLESYIKNIIESDLNVEDIDPEQDIPDQVSMNFQIPNAMFLAFLMNGIVSLDPEQENNGVEEIDFNIEEFLKMKNAFPPKPPKRKYRLDFDEYFKDWNPEP